MYWTFSVPVDMFFCPLAKKSATSTQQPVCFPHAVHRPPRGFAPGIRFAGMEGISPLSCTNDKLGDAQSLTASIGTCKWGREEGSPARGATGMLCWPKYTQPQPDPHASHFGGITPCQKSGGQGLAPLDTLGVHTFFLSGMANLA